jgi:hypothetical protein
MIPSYQLDLTRPGIRPADPRSRRAIRLILNLRRVARQLRQLQAGVEAFFERQGLVVGDVLQLLALGGVLLHQLLDALITVDGAFLGHVFLPSRP